ncbi:MAG: ImmA/IrrE family metallo-endopeptidase [Bacilli bacterium]|nr:ImmA/IrrE family metallo-endopeptidase [Bacilli bacterium]
MSKIRLRDERYEYIKKKVVKTLVECDIHTIPINPFEICKKRKYVLIKYTDKYTEEEMKIICERFPNGLNYFHNGERIIEYNDSLTPERIRTTIFHEIGHIELKHTCECTLAENEAEWFGVYIIAPPPLVNLFSLVDPIDLALKFNTSMACGYYSMVRFIKWKRYSLFLKDYERRLVKQFDVNHEQLTKKEEVI